LKIHPDTKTNSIYPNQTFDLDKPVSYVTLVPFIIPNSNLTSSSYHLGIYLSTQSVSYSAYTSSEKETVLEGQAA